MLNSNSQKKVKTSNPSKALARNFLCKVGAGLYHRPIPSHSAPLGVPLPLTKQQKESSNNFKKHFCSACRLQSLPGCLHLPALGFPLQGKLFPAGTEGGTWAGGNGVAKHKPACAGEGLCGCVGMGGSVQPSCCTTHPAPRTGTRLRAGDSLCPAEWKIILATAPHSAGPRRVRGREGFVCFGVSTAPVVMWGLRSPGCGWGWGTSMNCQTLGEESPWQSQAKGTP